MTLLPIRGAPPGAPNPDFPGMAAQQQQKGSPKPTRTTLHDPQEFDISNEQVDWLLTGLRLLEDAYLAGREAPLDGLLTDGGRHTKPSVQQIHDLYERMAGR